MSKIQFLKTHYNQLTKKNWLLKHANERSNEFKQVKVDRECSSLVFAPVLAPYEKRTLLSVTLGEAQQ